MKSILRFTYLTAWILISLAVILYLLRVFVYIPLKYHNITRLVETARTAEEERRAFLLAGEQGRIWEVFVEWPEKHDSREKIQQTNALVRIEWLTCSPISGLPYQTRRALTDTNNLQLLYKKYPPPRKGDWWFRLWN
jgi:hypothetical protein